MAGHHAGHATGGVRIVPQTTPKYNKFSLNDAPQQGSSDISIDRTGVRDRYQNSGMLIHIGRDQD